jgi:hypothetical protein
MVHPGLRVGDLVELIEHQEVLLPDFQRGYVWRRPQMLKFLDSLYRGYPIGQILLWIPPGNAEANEAVVENARPVGFQAARAPGEAMRKETVARTAPPQFVLDGQQRLTSLYKVLRAEPGARVRFQAADEIFQIESSVMAKDPRWVSVTDVLATDRGLSKALSRLQKDLKLAPDDPQFETLQANLQRLALVRERVLPVAVVRLSDPEQVAELFVRINSGTPLRRAELALAQLAWRWPGALMGRLGDAVEDFQESGFDCPAPFLMRCFVAVATGQASFQNVESLWKLSDLTLAKNWDKTYQGLRASVAFVQEVARLPGGEDLPSFNALLPMCSLFARSIRLDAAQTHQLLYWFLVASAFGRYGSSVESRLNEDLRALYTETPLKSLLENLGKFTGLPAEVPAADLEGKGVGSSVFILMASLMRIRGVMDWWPAATSGRRPPPLPREGGDRPGRPPDLQSPRPAGGEGGPGAGRGHRQPPSPPPPPARQVGDGGRRRIVLEDDPRPAQGPVGPGGPDDVVSRPRPGVPGGPPGEALGGVERRPPIAVDR